MMRMLQAGGLEVVTDQERTADEDNPLGYYELEAVKRTSRDPSWVTHAAGKVVKVISELLRTLPEQENIRYKVIFMRRTLDEVLASQKRMLERRGELADTDDHQMKQLFVSHLEDVEAFLRGRADIDSLFISYNRLVIDARLGAERVNQFLGNRLDLEKMIGAVEPTLYRNRA
jgi:hypothetical protein